MIGDNIIEQTSGNNSFCGFIAFIRKKLMSGLYHNFFNCAHDCTIITIFFMIILMFMTSLSYFGFLLFDILGYTISLTNSCHFITCLENNSNTGIIKYVMWKGKHDCCACNLNSGKYVHHGEYFLKLTNENSCGVDANIDYAITGISFLIFGILALFALFFTIFYLPRCFYLYAIKQWEEYISKKIDSRIRNLNGKQYVRLDVKDSNILYENDVEQCVRDKNKYYQQALYIPETESDNESDISDHDMQNINHTKIANKELSTKLSNSSTHSDDCVFIDHSDCNDIQ